MRVKKKKCHEVILIDTPYCPDPGKFARTQKINGAKHKVDHWFYCRDIFHNILWNLKIFFFSHGWKRGSSVIAFMEKVEDMLDVQPRSEYGLTQVERVMWVKPSVWWTKYGMRRSVYTILLRAGLNYVASKDNPTQLSDWTDIGDFVGIKGYVFTTKTGETSIVFHLLVKSIHRLVNLVLVKPSYISCFKSEW